MSWSYPPCPYCGAPLNPNARFCSQCGRTVRSAVPPTQRESPPVGSYSPTQYVPPPEPAYPEPTPSVGQPPAAGRSPWLYIGLGAIAGLCLLVLLGAVIVGGLYLSGGEIALFSTHTATATGTATLQPTETPPPPTSTAPLPPSETPDARPLFEFNGVRLRLEPGVTTQIIPEVVPAYTDLQGAPWDVAPEHTVLHLVGYPLYPEAMHKPRLIIYPIDEYLALRPELGTIVTELRQLLDQRPAEVPADKTLPFLPPFNAGQVFHTALRYVDFGNGRGLRYLTQYAQAIYPVTSKYLFYTYQGISNDGRFYVAAILPVAHPILPDESTYTIDDAFMNNFNNYLAGVARDLAAQPPESFSPSLSALDAMLATLSMP